ncbi:MAG TPA: hypothetical protein VFV35_06250 [Acidimicrobiales bacterium]|nr:hypothetical protein [Acidimicrobiales bacterium]
MLEKLQITRTRAVVAAAVATATVSGFTLAWANTSPSTDPAGASQLASSSEATGDASGPCDELENATKPECAGSPTVGSAAGASPAPTSATGGGKPAPTAPTSPAAPATAGVAAADVRRLVAADAGTVTYAVDGGSLTLVEATPAAGWVVEVEQGSGRELDLDFRSGTRRVQVEVEFEDGTVRERVRTRDDADDSRTEIVNGAVTDSDDDNSGPGSADSDDDNSGPGGDSDDS